LPVDPQQVVFTTSDGVDLEGIFYPASTSPAPLIILMHWAPGDQNDWIEVAYWLQNRGLGSISAGGEIPWMDTSWFPEIDSAQSFNIFTFTFRNCVGGCHVFERDKWYVDVQAAVEYGYELEGIDQANIIMIGASIGADGVADGCAYLNQIHADACDGALSLSPGNYLTIDYEGIVKELGKADEPKPAWCLFAESDPESAAVCRDIDEENYMAYSYPAETIFSNGHGMNLIVPDQEPDVLEVILEFIELVS